MPMSPSTAFAAFFPLALKRDAAAQQSYERREDAEDNTDFKQGLRHGLMRWFT